MKHAARKISNGSRSPQAESAIDVARARIVRRGPREVRLTLRALREAAGLSQTQVARKSGIPQPEISKLEAASSFDDRMVATLRRYLAALGDELEIVAVSKHGHRIGLIGHSAPKRT